MRFDDILRELGEFGYYQKRLYFLLCLPSINVGSFMMMVIIVLYTPSHRCRIPGLANDTYAIQGEDHELLLNKTIPGTNDVTMTYDQCHVFDTEGVSYDHFNRPINASLMKCEAWVYDKSVFYKTFTSQVNLVCQDSFKTSHAQMLFYFGVLVGNFLLGLLADIIGRKKTLYLGLVLLLAVSVGVTWAPDYYTFAVLMFVIGGLSHGAFMCCCVIGLELVGPSKRIWSGNVIQGFFAVGIVYLAGVSYLLRDWMHIELACAVPCVCYLLYWWFVPESPRWLLSQGRTSEAEKVIRHAARVNKVDLPASLFDDKTLTPAVSEAKVWHLFTHPTLLKRTLILYFNWMIVSMTYYGVSMNSGNMAGDFYLNFFLMGVAEFPGYAAAIFLLDKIGRKKGYCLFMCTGGVACISTVFTVLFGGKELEPLTVALAFTGKVGAAAAFGTIYIFSAELYPTVVRNAGMGTSSCAARVGGMLAPYIAKSGELIGGRFGQAEPLVVFGGLTILAGLLCLLLPETLDQKLPETIEDGINFGTTSNQTERAEYEVEIPFLAESKRQ